MRVLLVFLGLFVYQVKCTNFTQPGHSGLTQAARLNCWKTNTEFYMRFLLYKNSDRIDLVYAANKDNLAETSVGVFDSNGNGIEGNGTEEFPFSFVVNGTGDLQSGIVLSPPASTYMKVRVLGTDVIRVDVMSKSRFVPSLLPYVVFAEDVLYAAACNFSEVKEQVVGTGVNVNGSSKESAIQVKETASLQAVVNAALTTTATIGQDMSLLATVNSPSIATGIYVYSCLICDKETCDGSVRLEFIDDYGCSIGNYISPFQNAGFQAAATPDFPVFSLTNQSAVYFQCTVKFCYNVDDLRCENYCLFRSARRKREANETAPFISIQKERPYKNPSVNGSEDNDPTNDIQPVTGGEPANITRTQADKLTQTPDDLESDNENLAPDIGDREQSVTMTLQLTVINPTQYPAVSQARIASPGDSDVALLASVLSFVGVLVVCMIVSILVFCRIKARRKNV